MMRRAYFGTNALILLGVHSILILLHVVQVFPYLATMFYPMLNIMALAMAILGYVERDKMKQPALIAGILGLISLVFWVMALIWRIQSSGV